MKREATIVAVGAGSSANQLTESAVLEAIAPHLARFKQPKRVLFVTDLPRNATCVAATDVKVYALGKADFKAALESSASFKDQIYATYFHRQ